MKRRGKPGCVAERAAANDDQGGAALDASSREPLKECPELSERLYLLAPVDGAQFRRS